MVNDKLVRVPAPSTLHVMLGRLTTEVDVLLATDVKWRRSRMHGY
jgi:hypothetical protein